MERDTEFSAPDLLRKLEREGNQLHWKTGERMAELIEHNRQILY